MNRKNFIAGLAAMALGLSLVWGTVAEAAVHAPLRYFMEQPGAYTSETPYGNNDKAGHYVQSGDAKIYYEVYGQGKPLFVFHGGGVGSPYEMGQLIDRLRQNYQVIAVSTRGHGRSEIGHTPLTYEQKAQDMLAVMKEVTSEPAVLLGFSDGAYTAYKVASMYPQRVDRLIAIGAGTLKPRYFQGDMRVEDLSKIDPAFIEQQRQIMPEPERYQEFCTNYMNFWSKMEVNGDFLKTIKCPVLLMVGDEDDHAPVATVLEAHQAIPNSRLCVVPKAWHSAFIDNFPVTWAAMQGFLDKDTQDLLPSKKVPYNG
ncbi:MAG: alpha/beta hydrolase [Selenomonas sp.]|uniref:alpha/beta fold hydrolase n=1 Tax=Selenomonas sp. TaxID=2053611 RepID=UPI0025D119AD|nr:alpha/beta hydrolase [Selenomonas sp.]MCR5758720.1 alpha/beta hydrolase [Selenomonas sp.]